MAKKSLFEVTKLRYYCGHRHMKTLWHPIKGETVRVAPPRWVLEKKGVVEGKNKAEALRKWNKDKPRCLKIKSKDLKLVK